MQPQLIGQCDAMHPPNRIQDNVGDNAPHWIVDVGEGWLKSRPRRSRSGPAEVLQQHDRRGEMFQEISELIGEAKHMTLGKG